MLLLWPHSCSFGGFTVTLFGSCPCSLSGNMVNAAAASSSAAPAADVVDGLLWVVDELLLMYGDASSVLWFVGLVRALQQRRQQQETPSQQKRWSCAHSAAVPRHCQTTHRSGMSVDS